MRVDERIDGEEVVSKADVGVIGNGVGDGWALEQDDGLVGIVGVGCRSSGVIAKIGCGGIKFRILDAPRFSITRTFTETGDGSGSIGVDIVGAVDVVDIEEVVSRLTENGTDPVVAVNVVDVGGRVGSNNSVGVAVGVDEG